MPKVITKKSTVVGKVPVPTDLDIGELAVNTADKKLYTKHSDGRSTDTNRLASQMYIRRLPSQGVLS